MLVGGALGPLNASSQAIDQLVGRYRPWDLVQLLSQLRVPFGEYCVPEEGGQAQGPGQSQFSNSGTSADENTVEGGGCREQERGDVKGRNPGSQVEKETGQACKNG